MNAEIKEKWIKALESGDYMKARKNLYGGGGCYCAIGVLCDVINPGGWKKGLWATTHVDFEANNLGELKRSDVNKVIALNDKDNLTFKEIASWLKEASL